MDNALSVKRVTRSVRATRLPAAVQRDVGEAEILELARPDGVGGDRVLINRIGNQFPRADGVVREILKPNDEGLKDLR